MFCIGKLLSFKGKRGEDYSGCIKQICPQREEIVLFKKKDAYQEGTLIKHPERIIGEPYVAYNLDQEGRPGLVSHIENVKPDSLYRLIRENCFAGPDMENIIQKYSREEVKSEIMEADTKNETERNNIVWVTEEIVQQDTENEPITIDDLLKRDIVFDIDQWKRFATTFKIQILCALAAKRISAVSEEDGSFREILEYEAQDSIPMVYSLLLFFQSYKSQTESGKKERAQEAHKHLVLAIYNSKKLGIDISQELNALFPMCPYGDEENRYCDLYYNEGTSEDGQMRKRLTCSHYERDNHFRPLCDDLSIEDYADAFNAHNNEHFKKVEAGQEKADFRDLIQNCGFELNWFTKSNYAGGYKDIGYVYLMTAYVNRIDKILPYLTCSQCGEEMAPDFNFKTNSVVYTLTHFKCIGLRRGMQHDEGIYINHCFRCRSMTGKRYIIDERECIYKARELYDDHPRDNYFVCMRCGGTETIYPRKLGNRLKCPKCGEPGALFIDETKTILCQNPRCNHNGIIYGVEPQVRERNQEIEELPF